MKYSGPSPLIEQYLSAETYRDVGGIFLRLLDDERKGLRSRADVVASIVTVAVVDRFDGQLYDPDWESLPLGQTRRSFSDLFDLCVELDLQFSLNESSAARLADEHWARVSKLIRSLAR